MTEPSLEEGYPDPEVEGVDETFEIISNKEKILRDNLIKAENDFIASEVNNELCVNLISFYKAEIKKESKKNAPKNITNVKEMTTS